MPDPEGRFCISVDWAVLEPDPEWVRLDDQPNLVTSYSIQRGRSHELTRMDTGRATVEIIDPDGYLNPNNPDKPYYGKLKPLLPATIGRRNPVTDTWELRFRGYIEDFDYGLDRSQQFNQLTVTLVDLFELLNAGEMQPGMPAGSSGGSGGGLVFFGDDPPPDSTGQVWFPEQPVDDRMTSLLTGFGLAADQQNIMPGNVQLQATVYSPGESVLTGVQEAADAEFPAVASAFVDRRGRLTWRNRPAKFDPTTVAATPGIDWDFHHWKTGDSNAITASPSDTVQLREMSFNRGLASIINSATASPVGIEDEDMAGQHVTNPDSISFYGIRSWSAFSLLTKSSLMDDATALEETQRMSHYFCDNYQDIRDRPTIGFRSLHPDDPRAPALWEFLSLVEVGDQVQVTVTAAGSTTPVFTTGGSDQFYVEGIQEDARPLTPDYDDVTVQLILSPVEYYIWDPWSPDYSPPGSLAMTEAVGA